MSFDERLCSIYYPLIRGIRISIMREALSSLYSQEHHILLYTVHIMYELNDCKNKIHYTLFGDGTPLKPTTKLAPKRLQWKFDGRKNTQQNVCCAHFNTRKQILIETWGQNQNFVALFSHFKWTPTQWNLSVILNQTIRKKENRVALGNLNVVW